MFTPLAYMGAAYYNGEDGLDKIKTFIEDKVLGNETPEKRIEVEEKVEAEKTVDAEEKVEAEILTLSKDDIIAKQEAEINALKERVNKLEKLVESMQEKAAVE